MGIDGILVRYAVGDDDQALRFGHDVLGLVRGAGHDAVANLHARHAGADRLDDTEVAVADPAGVAGGAGHLVRAFVVAAVGADFERGDAGLYPDLVVLELAHVQFLIFDSQIAWAVQHRYFHFFPPFRSGWLIERERSLGP